MSLSKYCLDTHPLVWYFTGQKTLSAKAKKILDDIFSGQAECFISIIVLLETYHLSLKNRNFIFPKFLEILRLKNIMVVPLDKVVLSACFKLSPNLDIHDRVISATSKVNNCLLITKDESLRRSKSIKTLW